MTTNTRKRGSGTQALQLVILVGAIGLVVVSFAHRRQLSAMEERFGDRLGRLESRLARGLQSPALPAEVSVDRSFEAAPPARETRPATSELVGVPASPYEMPEEGRVYTFDVSQAPSLGPVDAPVTIVEFSDFQCGFCRRAQPTIERLREVYGERIRLVWKHLPLEMHADAPTAHLASVAAANQGKFWEFKHKLFSEPGELKPDDLRQHAYELGLELDRFERETAALETRRIVEADMAEAVAIDLTATPGFFINGRYIRGAQPFEVFAEAIDAELARLGLPIPEKREPESEES